MEVEYNGVTFDEGRTTLQRQETAIENSAGQLMGYMVRVTADITIAAAGAAAMEAAYADAIDAFSSNGFDFIVRLPGGTQSDNLSLDNDSAVGGVRVMERPSIDSLAGGIYTTFLPFRVVLEAEYPAVAGAEILREFEETVSFSGGGPVYGWLKPLRGRPQPQLLRQADTYRATQVGHAIGYQHRPNPPAAIWPAYQIQNLEHTKRSPRRRGASFIDYFTSWSYVFESDTRLIGSPHAWLS